MKFLVMKNSSSFAKLYWKSSSPSNKQVPHCAAPKVRPEPCTLSPLFAGLLIFSISVEKRVRSTSLTLSNHKSIALGFMLGERVFILNPRENDISQASKWQKFGEGQWRPVLGYGEWHLNWAHPITKWWACQPVLGWTSGIWCKRYPDVVTPCKISFKEIYHISKSAALVLRKVTQRLYRYLIILRKCDFVFLSQFSQHLNL